MCRGVTPCPCDSEGFGVRGAAPDIPALWPLAVDTAFAGVCLPSGDILGHDLTERRGVTAGLCASERFGVPGTEPAIPALPRISY